MTIQKKPVYTPADLNGFDAERQLGLPGEYPFTRGIHPTMYRRRLWTMRQFAGFGSPEDRDRKSTRLNSSHITISYAVFCLKKKKKKKEVHTQTRNQETYNDR